MGLVSFIKCLFGRVGSSASATPPVARPVMAQRPPPATTPKPPSPPPPPPRPSLAVMFRSEEMLDRPGRLAGYRFSFNAPDGRAHVAPGERLEALRSANVQSLAARRLAVIAMPLDDWLQEDFASLNAAHTVFQICIPEGGVTDDWLAGLRRIRDSGAGVALSCIEFKTHLAPALALATHAFVDFAASSVEKFECLVKDLRQSYPSLILAVDNVATWPERRLCMALGAEFAMGDFLSTVDAQEKGEKLTESRMVLMDMLNLVRNDGDIDALAEVAKRDPGVAVRLLSMANSPAYGLTKPLTGIDQAIVLLGRETLYRWLAVSVFRAGGDSARDKALLEVALARARFLELVALSVGSRQQADELFLVGLLSFVDTLLGMPMKDIVASMSLPPVVRDVLLGGEGPYAPYLLLVVSVEKCRPERAAQLAGALGIDLDGLTHHRTAALLWAEEAMD